MSKIKKFIVNKVSKNNLAFLILIYRYKRKNISIFKTCVFSIKALFKFKTPGSKLSKGKQIRQIFEKCDISVNNEEFFYNFDIFTTVYRTNRIIENVTIDYNKILDNSLLDFKKANSKLKNSKYKDDQLDVIEGIEEYIDRICVKLNKFDNKKLIVQYLNNIKDKSSNSFEESIQRILFFNQLLWQAGHGLNGLGRLDKILDKYYYQDIKNGKITEEQAKKYIKEMFLILHKDYWYKSSVLLGDTGQVVILGGLEENEKYFCNKLTYLFIEAIKELQIPDPKIFLRVSKNVPRDLIELSLECIKTGIGCPLFSNDDQVINKLIAFGISKKDACNYVTSACWEPLIVGKSVDQNNIDSLVFMDPLNEMLESEDLKKIKSYEKFLAKYKKYLDIYVKKFIKDINEITWEESPLLSMFTDGCNQKLLDVAYGGAKYSDYGLTSVSLGNVVNCLYNINEFVYKNHDYSLEEFNNLRKQNFVNNEILKKLKEQPNRYGTDNNEIINLTNEITSVVDKAMNLQKNPFSGKYKFGFSAPTYIIKAESSFASFDGRRNGEPFLVHISTDKSSVAYTELIQFASKLDYSNHRFNGNVIDFMINPSFIENNFDKMVDFLLVSIELGFFQMQMNVISSEILINAKKNPKEYKDLIVRVWGFSAYFNDLPDSYKDLLIERALKNEGKSF